MDSARGVCPVRRMPSRRADPLVGRARLPARRKDGSGEPPSENDPAPAQEIVFLGGRASGRAAALAKSAGCPSGRADPLVRRARLQRRLYFSEGAPPGAPQGRLGRAALRKRSGPRAGTDRDPKQAGPPGEWIGGDPRKVEGPQLGKGPGPHRPPIARIKKEKKKKMFTPRSRKASRWESAPLPSEQRPHCPRKAVRDNIEKRRSSPLWRSSGGDDPMDPLARKSGSGR